MGRPVRRILGGLLLAAAGAGAALGVNALVQDAPSVGSSTTASPTGPVSTASTALSPSGPTTTAAPGPPAAVTIPPSAPPAGYPAPTTTVGPAGDLVTPTVVTDVLATTWRGFAQAMTADDRVALPGYTSPDGLSAAVATLDCGCLAGPLAYATAVTSVPQQHGYPLAFLEGLGGTAYDQQRLTRWVVFTKESAGAPWVVSSVAEYVNGSSLAQFAPFSALPALAVAHPLAEGPAELASYFQEVDSTGDPGTGAPDGFASSPILQEDITNSVNSKARARAAGFSSRYQHSVDWVSSVFPQVVGDRVVGAMSCFALHTDEVVTSSTGGPVVQVPDQSVFGPLVPPGTYRQVTLAHESDICIGEDAESGITVLAESGGNYRATTTPYAQS